MANKHTIRMIEKYMSRRSPTRFLSGFFTVPEGGYHNSEYVEIDIEREDEDVAVVITDWASGPRMNTSDTYTSKKFKPPAYDEGFPVTRDDLGMKQAGDDPYKDPDFQANIVAQFLKKGLKLENKIIRAVELQASQILTTGKLDLKNAAGVTLYTLDFKPKSTHFVTAGTAWNAPGADIAGDISAIAELNRNDGLSDSDLILFDEKSWRVASADDSFRAKFSNQFNIEDNRIVAPRTDGRGGTFRGYVTIDHYVFEMWSYSGRYNDPQTGNKTKYLPDGNVIVMSKEDTRLDATFGSIPQLVAPDPRVNRYLPGRISGEGRPIDMTFSAAVDEWGRVVKGAVGTRPLLIPTAIDTFGRIDTGV